MLEKVEISHFRCFPELKVSNFKQINLIGGKNNSGKTTLLEALFLLTSSTALAALVLKENRRESIEILKQMPESAWTGFFHYQDIAQPIRIAGQNDDRSSREIEIRVESSFRNIFPKQLVEEEKIQELVHFLSARSKISAFTLTTPVSSQESNETALVAHREGILNVSGKDLPDSVMLPSGSRTDTSDLTRAFDQARLDNRDAEVLKLCQVLDASIEKIESFFIGAPNLYLTCHGQPRLPLSLFGDAINRVADIALKIINSKYQVVFIDEIENGLHYTIQKRFWEAIFDLCKELNIQIFATTHSLEMISAFAQAGLEKEPDKFAYFELARQAPTNKIVAIYRDLETLDYTLQRDRGQGIRGD